MRQLLLVLSTCVICLSGLAGCQDTGAEQAELLKKKPRQPPKSPVQPQELQNLKTLANNALERAKKAALKNTWWDPGSIWLLQQFLKLRPDPELQKLTEVWVRRFSHHELAFMINPKAERMDLAKDPGRGIEKLFVYIKSPFGKPQKRAVKFIKSYVSTKQHDYVLTHQFMTVVWAKRAGLKLPAKVIDRKQELLKQIAAEQAADNGFSDLYTERAVILLMYDKPSLSDAALWIKKILKAQESDGSWHAYSYTMEYDNEKITVGGSGKFASQHSTALSMLALGAFLENF